MGPANWISVILPRRLRKAEHVDSPLSSRRPTLLGVITTVLLA